MIQQLWIITRSCLSKSNGTSCYIQKRSDDSITACIDKSVAQYKNTIYIGGSLAVNVFVASEIDSTLWWGSGTNVPIAQIQGWRSNNERLDWWNVVNLYETGKKEATNKTTAVKIT